MVPIQSLRLSEKAKKQLATLKRNTGIRNRNVLCRWAFCISVAEPTTPVATRIPTEGGIDMAWNTFGGTEHEVYGAALKARCKQDGLPVDRETLNDQFRLHVHRGLGYLLGSSDLRGIVNLMKKVV